MESPKLNEEPKKLKTKKFGFSENCSDAVLIDNFKSSKSAYLWVDKVSMPGITRQAVEGSEVKCRLDLMTSLIFRNSVEDSGLI